MMQNKLLNVKNLQTKGSGAAFLITGVFLTLLVAFLYFDRSSELSAVIQNLGAAGMLLAVMLMAVFCLTPIPSEGLVVVFLKIYGIYLGTFLAWLGCNLSTLVIFFAARHYGQLFFKKLLTPERFKLVDSWVNDKGTWGLFIARLLPLPAFIVNYAAGMIPSIKLWPYFWTAALSIIPYYVGTALVYLGITAKMWIWLVIGGAAILIFWSVSYLLNRKSLKVG
ncbi:TVP38/TMEM64 family protein [Desulfitobacterium chlororespirans]|nr:VTT domain-containing protein [Desulfitobacterium chlororespirans]